MRSSYRSWVALTICSLAASACTDLGVGDPCIPEAVPCDPTGTSCGYEASEAYVEASSVQCRSRLCLVYKLDNGTRGSVPSDPRVLCADQPDREGCVTARALDEAVYCTCRCKGSEHSDDNCACLDGFRCKEVLGRGGAGIRGSYCIKDGTAE